MVDQTGVQADSGSTCPWCSNPLPAGTNETCPSCGATLVAHNEAQLPGVTTIDAEAIVRGARAPLPRQRSRLLSWISGEYDDTAPETPAAPESIAPPDEAVRREMLRLEIEAEVANLQAEAGSLVTDEELDALARAQAAGAQAAAAAEADGETYEVADDAAATAAVDAAEPKPTA